MSGVENDFDEDWLSKLEWEVEQAYHLDERQLLLVMHGGPKEDCGGKTADVFLTLVWAQGKGIKSRSETRSLYCSKIYVGLVAGDTGDKKSIDVVIV